MTQSYDTMINTSRRLLLLLTLAVACIGCDQATKHIARTTLAQHEAVSLLNDIVRLEYAENRGAFLSMGATLPGPMRTFLFVALTSIALAALVFYVLRARGLRTREIVAFSLIASGGVGNLIDRAAFGAVTDFVSIGFPQLRTGIFNVADVAVSAGVLLLAWSLLTRSSGKQGATAPLDSGDPSA